MKITLCLLTLNEINGCKHDIPLINRQGFDDIFALDGGSSDGTVEYLKSKHINVIRQIHKGLNAAHIQAVDACKTDAVIFFHPKGTIPVKDLLKFKKCFDNGYELVVASRVIKNSQNEEDNRFFKPRKWLVIILSVIVSATWRREGNHIWDILHGFRGYTVEAFKKINPPKNGLTIDMAGVVQSYKKNIKRIEFPVKEKFQKGRSSHFKIIPVGREVFKYFLKEIFISN